jgi:hypothetical protein
MLSTTCTVILLLTVALLLLVLLLRYYYSTRAKTPRGRTPRTIRPAVAKATATRARVLLQQATLSPVEDCLQQLKKCNSLPCLSSPLARPKPHQIDTMVHYRWSHPDYNYPTITAPSATVVPTGKAARSKTAALRRIMVSDIAHWLVGQ